ncbi:MAG: transglutaminase domain-containing protein [Gammaproteobacteria bacterium]
MFGYCFNYPASESKLLYWLVTSLLLLSLFGCASGKAGKSSLLDTLRSLESTQSRHPAELENIDILALNENARRFIDSRVSGVRDPYERVRALRSAVFDADGLGFSLNNELTLTADETFEQVRGNCVALANFFVAAARHLGVDARFQELERNRQRGEQDIDSGEEGFRVIERHINVSGNIIWRGRRARYVLDYLAVPEEDFGQSTIISDQRAFAHYYNNIAIQHLQQGELETALQYLKKAILEDDRVDFVWSNLGVVYARRGDYEATEFAYQRALDLNTENPSARSNLRKLQKRQRIEPEQG